MANNNYTKTGSNRTFMELKSKVCWLQIEKV